MHYANAKDNIITRTQYYYAQSILIPALNTVTRTQYY